jgi:glutaredoxin 3
MSQVTVYTTDPCSYCSRVKGLLSSRGVEFAEVDLTGDRDAQVELVQQTGMMTFPQVLVGERLLGGFSELEAAVRSGRLEALLAA